MADRERDDQEWAIWRGQMDEKLDLIAEIKRDTASRIDLLSDQFNQRMDRQDGVIDRILVEAKLTNGRITALEQENHLEAELAAKALKAEEERHKAEEERHRESERHTWHRNTTIATVTAILMFCGLVISLILHFT